MGKKRIVSIFLVMFFVIGVVFLSNDIFVTSASTPDFMDGSGTEEDPYLISSKRQLDNVRKYKDAHFKLMTDIKFTKADFSPSGDFYNDGFGWVGIGFRNYYGESSYFSGTFDGNGHVIDGLYQNVTDNNLDGVDGEDYIDCRGLFGHVSGTIKNLGLTNVDLNADTNNSDWFVLAGIAEELDQGGVIDNCFVTGDIDVYDRCEHSGDMAAGVCGSNSYGIISHCYNGANINVNKNENSGGAGGICAISSFGKISNCYNVGNITGIWTNEDNYNSAENLSVGGICLCGGEIDNCYNVGNIYSSDVAGGVVGEGSITQNSYNKGNVYGKKASGGISGYLYLGGSSIINNCYNIGEITGDNLVGEINAKNDYRVNAEIFNCFFIDNGIPGVVDVEKTKIENLVSCTQIEMKDPKTFVGFDFSEIWTIDSYSGYEYPILRENRDINSKKVKNVESLGEIDTIVTSVGKEPVFPVVKVIYEDDSYVEAQLSSINFRLLDLNVEGEQVHNVEYAGKEYNIPVKFDIESRKAKSIDIISEPTKKEYVQGQPLDLSGSKIHVTYDNDTEEEREIEESMISYDVDAIGAVVVAVEIDDITASFSITVNQKVINSISAKDPIKLNYYVGDDLDITGGKVVVTYVSTDYYSEEIDMTLGMISGFDSSTVGVKSVKVTYNGFETEFSVNVKAVSLDRIEVTNMPSKTEYVDDEAFDETGLVITGYYIDGKEETLTDYEISGFGDGVDENIITVKKENKTATFKVTIHKSAKSWTIFDSTCTEDGYKTISCIGCEKELKREIIKAKGHTEETISAKSPTCTEKGSTAGVKCSVCNEVLVEPVEIDALGHDYQDIENSAIDPTCTEDGKEADKKCTRCASIQYGATINKKGHTIENIPLKFPTCTEKGNTAGAVCSVCNKVLVESEEIAKLGHDYHVVANSAVEPTCTEAGKQDDVKCSRCDSVISGDVINPTGHNIIKCNEKSPSCVENGNCTYWTCNKCDKFFSDEKGNNEIEKDSCIITKLGHDYHDIAGTYKNPTCTEDGKEADKKCSRCETVQYGNKISKKGHVEEVIPAVEATYTSTGSTEGKRCSVCGTILVAPKEIPMLEKNNDSSSNTVDTDKNSGSKDKDKKDEGSSGSTNNNQKDDSSSNSSDVSDNGATGETAENSNENVSQYSNEWIDGKWYDEQGNQTYQGILLWKCNSTGWWVEDSSGWYPVSNWQKIDGVWYYFGASGYMATNEYVDGYWLNNDGSCSNDYYLTWKSNSTGWWIEDKSGWWPSSRWLKINGSWYYFNSSGYMVTNQYVDGYWIGSDGVCN